MMCICTPNKRTPWCENCKAFAPRPTVFASGSQTEASLRDEVAKLRSENARLRLGLLEVLNVAHRVCKESQIPE